ncbi:MAG: virB8 family protein [Lautropia sp.]
MSAVLENSAEAVRAGELDAHFRAARSWDQDRVQRLERLTRIAWIIAGVAVLVAVIAVIAVMMLTPLKQTVPVVLSVDRASGNVEVVQVAEPRLIEHQALLDKHWAQRYVIARESYNWRLLQSDYDTVLAMSSTRVGQDYAAIFEGAEARDKKLGPDFEMRVRILSVTPTPDAPGRMVVRFERQLLRVVGGAVEPPQSFVATLAFEYHVSVRAVEQQLLQNPLGFRVEAYRLDSEATNTRPNS